VANQGFIGETEARLRVRSRWEIAVVLDGRQPWKVRSWRRADPVNSRLYVCYSAVTFGVWLSKTLIVCVLRAIAGRRLVERES
jgi:hypothetical protein